MLTLSEISNSGACVGCGACIGVCKDNAIEIHQDQETGLFFPIFDQTKCSQCGICIKVCPAVNWSNGIPTTKDLYAFGNNAKAYSTFAIDKEHRRSAASGGFVTAFLGALLRDGQIDGAVVSRRIQGDPLRSEVILAKTYEEIVSCKGSIYSPVCFDKAFKQLREVSQHERWAVVGLPCHIQALALMMKQLPNLRKKVCLSISLVCGHFPTHKAYEYTFKHIGVKKNEVKNIYNRGEGWPGNFRIELKDGCVKRVPHGDGLSWGMVFASPLFMPKACHICPDPGGHTADIQVCDAWLPKFSENNDGVNLVLAKTDISREFLQKVSDFGAFSLSYCSVDDFILANKRVFLAKTRNHAVAVKYLFGNKAKFLHKNIIEINVALSRFVRFRLWFYYLHLKIALWLKLDRIAGMLPKAFLFYWKAVSLLKR